MTFVIRRLALVLVTIAGIAGAVVQAQNYPTRVITLVVPFAAGGPSDVIGRLIAQSMSQSLGEHVIVENIVGAGGTVAAARVARATPDGYTLLIHHLALAAAPSLYSNLSYDTRTAFQPIGLVNSGPMVLVGRKTLPASDGRELIAFLKQQGDKVTLAHAGIGSNAYLCALLLSREIGARQVYVPYSGTGPAMNDVVAGQVDALCDQSTNAVPQIAGGNVKGFIVTSDEPLDAIPDVATSSAVGLPSFNMTIWHGLYAPKGTPDVVVSRLNDALQKALSDPAIAARFKAVGTSPFPRTEWTADAHARRFQAEITRWSELLHAEGLRPGTVN